MFVPFGIPGETVNARITQDKGRFARAEIVEVLETAPIRVEPRCKHFLRCGGCHWQHVDYPAQLDFKRQVVIDQFARIGGLRDVTVHPVIASADPFYYRSHVTFHVNADGQPAFIAADDHSLLPIEECHIIQPELLAFSQQPSALSFQGADRVRVQIGTMGEPIAFPFNTDDDSTAVSTQRTALSTEYTVLGHTFRCTAGGFFQVNLAQAAKLVELVLGYLAPRPEDRILDLYAGVGLFTAFLAEQARHVSTIESFPPAVADARHNLTAFQNVEMHEGKVETLLPNLKGKFTAVVADPPRAGMDATALNALISRSLPRLVYVSCDPATLARDAKKLVAAGYQLREVQPVDMFPQTYHIESVAFFERG